MKVRDVMATDVISLTKDTTYEEAVKKLLENNYAGFPVIDDNDKLVGYLSEKDLFRALYPSYGNYYNHPESYTDPESREAKVNELKDEPISKFMTTNPITVSPDLPILSAGAIMLAHRVHKFPVVEHGRVIGVVSREMIYHKIFDRAFNK
ncbi:MAG: CBS domain-containing protein [Patescibacteria group bacterium]